MRKFWVSVILAIALSVAAISSKALAQGADLDEQDISERSQLLNQLYQEGKYREAIPVAEQVLAANAQLHGPEHRNTLNALNTLALLYKYTNRYEAAERLFEQALEGYERIDGGEHYNTLTAVNNLALLYMDTGQYELAEPLFVQALEGLERILEPTHPNMLLFINNLAMLYMHTGQYNQAESLFVQVLDSSEQLLGPDHPNTIQSLNNLAILHFRAGQYEYAEPLLLRAVESSERTLGHEHPNTLTAVSNLASFYQNIGQYELAEEQHLRVLERREQVLGFDHTDTLISVNNLGYLYLNNGHYLMAERLLLRGMEARERVLGFEHPDTLTSVNNLALLYSTLGRNEAAEPLAVRALEGYERLLGPEHPNTLTSASNLASLYQDIGRYEPAESLFMRALEGREQLLGFEHPDTLMSLHNLAALYQATGRHQLAEQLYVRALEGRERLLGPEHPDTLGSVNNLAGLYTATGRYEAAEPLYVRALETRERILGPEHPDTLISFNNLAILYGVTGRYEAAEPLYVRALETSEHVLGQEHPNTLTSVNNLAWLYQITARYEEAEPLYVRAVEARERVLGLEHPDTLKSLDNLAGLRSVAAEQLGTNLPPGVLDTVAYSLAVYARRFALEEPDVSAVSNPTSQPFLAQRMAGAYRRFLSAGDIPGDEGRFVSSAFALSQAFAFSSAGDALRASTAALTVDDPELRVLVQQANEASAELEAAEAALSSLLAQSAADQNPAAIEYARARVDRAVASLSSINDSLIEADLDLAELAIARTSTIAEVQAVLTRDEAVLFYSQAAEGDLPLAFVVTPTAAVAVPLQMEPDDLAAQVEAVRAGLDVDPGSDYRLTTADLRDQVFDLDAANGLHDAIFEPVRPYLNGARKLLVVADGPLQTIPMHVLVSELPGEGSEGFARYREATWLADEFAFARLPAVSSLVALRREETPPPAGTKQLLGFGDPVLARYEELALNNGAAASGQDAFGYFANASGATRVADLPSLRQTGVLLREVQTTLGLSEDDIYLGPEAVESALTGLSQTNELRNYRSLAFATHALINDEIEGLDEPAIVLTPVDGDDGLLRASDIVQLGLDADLVILAACNTAADDGSPGAEALSGLAKAFFYAGARSLLVSNWPAEATATAEMIPDIVRSVEQDGLSRSEALQRAMNTLRDEHRFDFYAHPALWAPYMVVADG